MKTPIVLIHLALATAALAQPLVIDTTTHHTNIVVNTGSLLTVPDLSITNSTFMVSNHWSVSIGDDLATVSSKANFNFNYFSNVCWTLSVLPNQINTNLASLVSALSNQVWLTTGTNAATVARIGTLGTTITNVIMQVGNDATNNLASMGLDLTNSLASAANDLTNLVAATGSDLTNRLDAIQSPGSTGSETVLKVISPSGTTWYLHVDDSGVLTITGSP